MIARAEGPGEWYTHYHFKPCKGVPICDAAKSRSRRNVRRVPWVALTGLDTVLVDVDPALQAGLSHCGLSARETAIGLLDDVGLMQIVSKSGTSPEV